MPGCLPEAKRREYGPPQKTGDAGCRWRAEAKRAADRGGPGRTGPDRTGPARCRRYKKRQGVALGASGKAKADPSVADSLRMTTGAYRREKPQVSRQRAPCDLSYSQTKSFISPNN